MKSGRWNLGKTGKMWNLSTYVLSTYILRWMQKNRFLAERIRERETHHALYVPRSIYLKVSGKFLLSSVYKPHVRYESRGYWKESWQGYKALCSLDPALATILAVRTWAWHFVKIPGTPSKHYPAVHAYPTESSTLCLMHKSLTVLLAMALDTR